MDTTESKELRRYGRNDPSKDADPLDTLELQVKFVAAQCKHVDKQAPERKRATTKK